MKKFSKLLFVFVLLFSCKSEEIKTTNQKALIFSEDFAGAQLSSKWQRGKGEGGKGKWTVKDGSLNIRDAKNDPLWLDLKLPENFLIEFQAQALSADGDIKIEVLGDGINHASGYILIFGGWKNKLDVIARLNEHGKDRKEQGTRTVISEKIYNFSISRTNETLVWKIDGKKHMSFQDKNPLKGNKHSQFAFSNWSSPLRFSKLRIYKL